jgi:hypothetical protein
MKTATAIVLLACCLTCGNGRTVLLHDASHKYLRGSLNKEPYLLSQQAASTTLAAAAALLPPYKVDQDDAQQAESIVAADVFNKPRAVVLLHIAGLSPEAGAVQKLTKLFGNGHTVQLEVHEDGKPASAVGTLQATSDLINVNPDAAVAVLDHSALKGCQPGICLAGHLATAAHNCGGKLHMPQRQSGKGGLTGLLELPGTETPLDMSQPAARLFGIELAGIQGSLQQEMQRLKEQQNEDQEFTVYESTFVGLQGLSAEHAKGSPEFAAAENALVALLGVLAEQLRQAYNDEVLYQVALLGDAPVTSSDAANLMGWKEVSRRALLQRSGGRDLLQASTDEGALSKSFANKATAYGVMLILIWFTFAAIYCMASMRFKQDTLLYGRTKTD